MYKFVNINGDAGDNRERERERERSKGAGSLIRPKDCLSFYCI